MKASVNKITETAKRRDTLGRNRVLYLDMGEEQNIIMSRLLDAQNVYSSERTDHLTKTIIKFVGVDGQKHNVLLSYSAMEIETLDDIISKEETQDGNK